MALRTENVAIANDVLASQLNRQRDWVA